MLARDSHAIVASGESGISRASAIAIATVTIDGALSLTVALGA
jgi:hypothetical protein